MIDEVGCALEYYDSQLGAGDASLLDVEIISKLEPLALFFHVGSTRCSKARSSFLCIFIFFHLDLDTRKNTNPQTDQNDIVLGDD